MAELDELRAEVETLRAEVAHLRSQQTAHVCATLPVHPFPLPGAAPAALPLTFGMDWANTCGATHTTVGLPSTTNVCAGPPPVFTVHY